MDEELDYFTDDENDLPNLNDYKYQHLYKYSGDEFINAFVLEMIIRIVEINNLMTYDMAFENLDFTIEYDMNFDNNFDFTIKNGKFILGEDIKPQDASTKKDDPFSSHLGLTRSYLANLFMMHPYYQGEVKNDLLDFTYNFLGDSIITTEIDLDLSESELIDHILKLKRDYEKKLNPLEALHIGLKNKIKKMLKKMPDTMQVKEQNIIKALFTYDYVQARNKQIDFLNIPDYEVEEDEKENTVKYPSFDPKISNCYFNEKKFTISGIKPGKGKELYYYFNPILTKYRIKLN